MSKNKTDPYKDWTPLFRLKPQSDRKAKCQFIGYCDDTGRLTDEMLEQSNISIEETVKRLLPDLRTIEYSIYSHYKQCNVLGNFLVQNDKIPIYYTQILYSKKFIGGCLFNLSLLFNVSEETKKVLDSPKKYIQISKDGKSYTGAFMDGTYSLELSVPQEDNFLKKIRSFVLDDMFKMHNKQFEQAQSEEEKLAIMNNVTTELNNKLELYKKFFDPMTIEKHPGQNFILEKTKTIISDPLFKELIVYGLMLREKERMEEREAIYEPPNKNVFNLKELKKNPDKVDEIFAKRSSSA
jgi:hypothetical protein